MREIDFRGKDKRTGEWVYGFYVKVDYRHYILEIYDNRGIVLKNYKWIEVTKETVGQYIGVEDKKGKRIFEGDIVYISDNYANEPTFHVIKYHGEDDWPAFDLDPLPRMIDCNQISFYTLSSEHYIEVVGNIHDNPELMEKIG